MESTKSINLLQEIIKEITIFGGSAATEKFSSLRAVDAKIREARMVLSSTTGLPPNFVVEMESDEDFQANSRRVRLEALAGYINNALKFLNVGGVSTNKKQIIAPPDISKITAIIPGLGNVINERWREAQKCQHIKAYTAAIILMGSVLEALLLCRANSSPSEAYQSSKAPKGKNGKTPAIQDWNLNTLIEVAVERKWIKTDRGKFAHALRESRNIVHPWVHASTQANFDEATCQASWVVLRASVSDLLASM